MTPNSILLEVGLTAVTDDLIDLRHRVLRPGRPRESAALPGDDLPTTRHYVARSNGRVVGCATFLDSVWEATPAWQLRGMATDPALQGTGVGRRLVEGAVADLTAADGRRTFWCNARASAAGFYRKLGWVVSGDPFEIEGIGPHYKMWWVGP